MAHASADTHPGMHSSSDVLNRADSPAYQAYQILHFAFFLAPIVAGLDKFFHYLVDWEMYVAPIVTRLIPISATNFMKAVAFKPSIGGWVVGAWLLGIVVNLVALHGYYDIALRDFGLALGAFALARLSAVFE